MVMKNNATETVHLYSYVILHNAV